MLRHGMPAGCRCIRAPLGAPPPLSIGADKEMRNTRAPTRRGNAQGRAQHSVLSDLRVFNVAVAGRVALAKRSQWPASRRAGETKPRRCAL